MAQNGWIGAANISSRITDAWIGVDGVARRIVAGYIGDENGKAQLCYKIGNLQFIEVLTAFSQYVAHSSCGKLMGKAIFAGGITTYNSSSGSEAFLSTVKAIDSNLSVTALANLSEGREYAAAGDILNNVLFVAGGRISNNPSGGVSTYYDSDNIDLYNAEFTHTTSALSSARWGCLALKAGNNMCICGGNQSISTGFTRQNIIDIFDSDGLLSLTTALPITSYGYVGVSHKGKAMLGGGRPTTGGTGVVYNMYAMDEDGIFTELSSLNGFMSLSWTTQGAASGGDYAYFVTDPLDGGNPLVEIYDKDFLKILPDEIMPDDIGYVKGVSTILDGVFFGGTISSAASDNIYLVSNDGITKIEDIGPLTDSNRNAIGVQVDSLLFLFTEGTGVYVYSY